MKKTMPLGWIMLKWQDDTQISFSRSRNSSRRGALSDTGLNLGITGSNFDMVIARNEGKDQLGIEGSDRGSAYLKELSLRNGVRSV